MSTASNANNNQIQFKSHARRWVPGVSGRQLAAGQPIVVRGFLVASHGCLAVQILRGETLQRRVPTHSRLRTGCAARDGRNAADSRRAVGKRKRNHAWHRGNIVPRVRQPAQVSNNSRLWCALTSWWIHAQNVRSLCKTCEAGWLLTPPTTVKTRRRQRRVLTFMDPERDKVRKRF